MNDRTGKTRAAEAVLSALSANSNATAAQLADEAGLGRSTATKALAELEQAGQARRVSGKGKSGRRLPDRWFTTKARRRARSPEAAVAPGTLEPLSGAPPGKPAPTFAAPRPTQTKERTRAGRLGKGELPVLVLRYLSEQPGRELTPSAVAKALNRSVGAVGNAMERLAAAGRINKTSVRPRRYALTNAHDR